jgi:hypothetical protein
MTNKALVLVALGACSPSTPSTPLAELQSTYGATRLEIVAKDQLNVLLHIDDPAGGCVTLGEDVSARFDGQPLNVVRGGYDLDSSGCWPIAFWITPLPAAAISGFERTTNGSSLEVFDHSARWDIEAGKLFANDFINDTANAQIIWSDVTSIATAQVSPSVPTTIDGNAIHYPKGTDIVWVSATAHPTPTRCAGPASCTVDLAGERAWTPVNP